MIQASAMQASLVTILFTDLVGSAALFERHGTAVIVARRLCRRCR